MMDSGELVEVTLECGWCGGTFTRMVPAGLVGICGDCWPVVEAMGAEDGRGHVVEMVCPDCGHRWLEVDPKGEFEVGCPQCGLKIGVELDDG